MYFRGLLSLPNELLFQIADCMIDLHDLNHFTQINRRTHTVLSSTLYLRDIKCKRDSRAMEWAIQQNRVETLYRFLRIQETIDTTTLGQIKLLESYYVREAIHVNNLSIVKILIKAAKQSGTNMTKLHHWICTAICYRNVAISRFLINEAGSPDALVQFLGLNLLEIACENRLTEIVRYLLERGAAPTISYRIFVGLFDKWNPSWDFSCGCKHYCLRGPAVK